MARFDRRWRVLACIVAAGCSRDAGTSPTPESAAANAPRRVLLVTLDTVRADRLGVYGCDRGITPNVDAVAKAGTRFAHAIAPMPETAPSHASMMSGRFPLSHGLVSNFVKLSPSVKMLAELLTESGVATAAFYHFFPFSEFDVTRGFETKMRDMSREATNVAPQLLAWFSELPHDKPAFAWLHLYVAHTPFVPPPDDLRRRLATHPFAKQLDSSIPMLRRLYEHPEETPPDYAVAFAQLYDADVAYCDRRFGEVLSGLHERGLLDDLLLIVTADHGESLDAVPPRDEPDVPGRPPRPGMFAMHASDVRQDTLHVPLVIRGPRVPPGRTVEPLVRLVDLAPTILEVFGVAPPAGIEGRSLWPLIRGVGEDGSESVDWDEPAWSTVSLSSDEYFDDGIPHALTLCQGRYKLQVERTKSKGEDGKPSVRERERLFDLVSDPREERDVASEHQDVVKALRRRLDACLKHALETKEAPGELTQVGKEDMQKLGYVK